MEMTIAIHASVAILCELLSELKFLGLGIFLIPWLREFDNGQKVPDRSPRALTKSDGGGPVEPAAADPSLANLLLAEYEKSRARELNEYVDIIGTTDTSTTSRRTGTRR